MVSAISNATQPQPVAQSTATSTQKPTSGQTKNPPPAGIPLKLSTAALAALATLKEATENPLKTATEAGNGDLSGPKATRTEAGAKSVAK